MILRRIWVSLLILILMLPVVGIAYQQIATSVNVSSFPPPGQFVEVDGRKLHFVCKGEGEQTILFDSGLGTDATLSWGRIIDALSTTMKACYYDRAGYGWSDAVPTDHDIDGLAGDLEAVVTRVSDGKPILLAGHSFSGIILRTYAKRNLDKIVGLVFVDSSHEEQQSRWPTPDVPEPSIFRKYAHIFGLTRLFAENYTPKFPWFGDLERARLVETASGVKYHEARIKEGEIFEAFGAQSLASMGYDFKAVPILVLSQDTEKLAGDTQFRQEQKKVWAVLQGELAGLSTRSKLVMIENTGHLIPILNPDAVIQNIRNFAALR